MKAVKREGRTKYQRIKSKKCVLYSALIFRT